MESTSFGIAAARERREEANADWNLTSITTVSTVTCGWLAGRSRSKAQDKDDALWPRSSS